MTTEMNRVPLQAAPAGESLERVRDRFVEHALRQLRPEHETITALADLYRERIESREPATAVWQRARDRVSEALDLDLDLDRALALDLDLALALALDLDLDRALALALDRALARDLDRALARDLDRALALVALLGDRLLPLPQLDRSILNAVEVEKRWELDMGSWHGSSDTACGTTHCRAGSAIVLHPLGLELERVFGSWLAGAAIYLRSTGRVPDFFADDEDALEDIRACAAQQRAEGG